MFKSTVEQKLRNLQLNLSQNRTEVELAQAGIYFPRSGSSSSRNIFSSYVDSIRKTSDSSRQTSNEVSYKSPYRSEYIPYNYRQEKSFEKQINWSSLPFIDAKLNVQSEDEGEWIFRSSFQDELKFPSANCLTNEKSLVNKNDTKTEFVNHRRKQFESRHVEKLVHDSKEESKTKLNSGKKEYDKEWNRLIAVADIEFPMKHAAHFENEFARLKSKYSNSTLIKEKFTFQDDYHPEVYSNQLIFDNSQSQSQHEAFKPKSTTFNSTSSPIPIGIQISLII